MLKTLNSFDITKPNIKPFYTTSNTEGYIYHDEENFYKLYRTNKLYLLERKELKTNMLDGYSLDNVVLPKGLLFTVKPAPVQTRKMVLYCKANMQSWTLNHL